MQARNRETEKITETKKEKKREKEDIVRDKKNSFHGTNFTTSTANPEPQATPD